MSLIYGIKTKNIKLTQVFYDYICEIKQFVKRIENPFLVLPMIFLKSIEWSIYRWYKTPIRRFYGIKGNELIYMITRRCTDHCPKCGIWKNPEQEDQHLPIHFFINCLERLQHNLYQVTLTGGEPLLFKKDIITIAEKAKKLDIPMVIVSNRRLLDKDFLLKYNEFWHILVISIDTIEKEKWNEFRGVDDFDIVMSNVLLAKNILKNKLRIQSVLSLESSGEIQKVVEFCRRNCIQHNTQLYQDFGGEWTRLPQEVADYNNDTPCAARKNICIYPNGDVVKCFDHGKIPAAKEPIGNIK